ncbi:hypothetical protein GJAV_G00031960 [Gymnothorax javanicus]|nr:hypothetical protein GJAV_G00031960 [Gymnothorax javanicus]
MALADQSQMWYPTSVQVTVHQARNLRIKGKNGTNDAYAIMQVAKDKFATSVAEKCVSPEWKEEATFDLPLFHHGNVERCTLHVIVNHRASVGLDKLLGQAVINLLELHEKKSRNKTEWFKLLDKHGKADKDRGEVLLDIQFMRNNMTASMFDLSMQDKRRSRIGKLKDKIRGKKKDGFSDSASAIVPSVSQPMTDSDGEGGDAQGTKKKSKLKTFFSPKSNLQRNVSQSMSTLGSLPEKNSTLSGSRSSGLNIDSPEQKKKFKFLTHKRTSSTDSKGSLGPFSLLSRSKQNLAEQNNLCINGSHVYAEEPEGGMSKGSSTLSLNSSDRGSVEDLRRTHIRNASDMSVDSLKGLSLPSYRQELRERTLVQQQQRKEEVEEEEQRVAAERRQAEAKRLQEEQEKKRQEEARLLEEQRLREELLKEEALRKQEEAKRAEEQKQQEEVTMGDRLSSLFGIIRRKEDKKEEEENPKPAPSSVLPSSDNPFEEIPLSSDTVTSFEERSVEPKQGVHNLQTPSNPFPSRTAKVSAVKPRFVESEKAETDKSKSLSPSVNTDSFIKPSLPPSPTSSIRSVSSISSSTSLMFANIHQSMAPPLVRRNSSDLLSTSNENLAAASTSMRRRALLPPSYLSSGNDQPPTHDPPPKQSRASLRSNSGVSAAKEEISGSGDPGRRGTPKNKGPTLPLPDYDTLYPKRIHGLQGQMKWDHIVAEVTQRNRDYDPELTGREMSVDLPSRKQDLQVPTPRDQSTPPEKPSRSFAQTDEQTFTFRRMGSGTKHAFTPPKHTTAASEKSPSNVGSNQNPSTRPTRPSIDKPNDLFASRVFGGTTPKVNNSSVPQAKPRAFVADENKMLNTSQRSSEEVGQNLFPRSGSPENTDNQARKVPPITPRQRPGNHLSGSGSQMENSAASSETVLQQFSAREEMENDPFPSQLPVDGTEWNDPFTGGGQNEEKLDAGMTTEDMEKLFQQRRDEGDPFSYFDSSDPTANFPKDSGSAKQSPHFSRSSSSKSPGNADGAVDLFSSASPSLPITSSLASPEPVKDSAGDMAPQPSGVSGGKAPVRAWVSPSDAQSSSGGLAVGKGGDPASTPRRPHPVKPMNALENQTHSSSSLGRDIKSSVIHENVPAKLKIGGSVDTRPYSQLTQDELVLMVGKLQDELSKKNDKITELEDYIDNLLVHVIEENPSILLTMANTKKAI